MTVDPNKLAARIVPTTVPDRKAVPQNSGKPLVADPVRISCWVPGTNAPNAGNATNPLSTGTAGKMNLSLGTGESVREVWQSGQLKNSEKLGSQNYVLHAENSAIVLLWRLFWSLARVA
jgi:hypothetical protein